MSRDVKVVRLRRSGIKARIVVLPKGENSFLASYIHASNKNSFISQVIYYYCENFLQEIIPGLVGKEKEIRQEVFEDLYSAIKAYNPEVESTISPIAGNPNAETFNVTLITPKASGRLKQKEKEKQLPTIPREKYKKMEEYLNTVVFGQEDAIRTIQEYFDLAISGMGDESRPRGSFLFVGDTGVGKTLCVKEMAKHFFGEDWRKGLFTINGSEYMEDHETSKLLGSPNGYVGFDEGSAFMKHVQANPETIILVDEFEKASNKLQDVFLQIMDEGVCYDNRGNQIDFTKCFIVFTSNIGTKEVYHTNSIGFGGSEKDVNTYVDSAIQKFCRIEFLKRFDGVVVFNRLEGNHYEQICKVELDKVECKLKEKSIRFEYSVEAISHLVKMLGNGDTSRDLNTIVRRTVTAPISKLLVSEEDFNAIEVSILDGTLKVRGVGLGET